MTDIGSMLREARMREHRDIAEFEARTKIRAKYLRALEDEEWGLLPGYTFAKAFLRTYADMLGLDGRMLVDEFKRQYQDPSELELSPVVPARGEARRSRERPGDRERDRPRGPSSRVLAVAVLVVLLAAALFAVHELRRNDTRTATTTISTTTTATRTSRRRVAAAPRRVALALAAVAPVRVCLLGYKTRSGAPLQRLYELLDPGRALPVYHADDRFVVSFDGGAARMTIDGHRVDVPASVAPLAFEILRSGAHRRLAAADAPRCT
jgi:hypothetical protein